MLNTLNKIVNTLENFFRTTTAALVWFCAKSPWNPNCLCLLSEPMRWVIGGKKSEGTMRRLLNCVETFYDILEQ